MTNFDNLTAEESDNLLRQEIFAEEDSNSESGINDSQEQEEEVSEAVETPETDTPEEESQEPKEQSEEEVKPKNKSNVAKILSEKNEYKRQAMEARAQVEELKDKLGQSADTDVSFFESKMKQMLAENNEKQEFFSKNPSAYEIKGDLDALIEETPSLSYDRAYTFYLAETNPQALLDEQTRNKLNSKVYSSSGRAPANARTTKTELTYSDAEFEQLVSEGKIRL